MPLCPRAHRNSLIPAPACYTRLLVPFLLYVAGEQAACRCLCLNRHPSSLPLAHLVASYVLLLAPLLKKGSPVCLSEGKTFLCSLSRSFSKSSPSASSPELGSHPPPLPTFPSAECPYLLSQVSHEEGKPRAGEGTQGRALPSCQGISAPYFPRRQSCFQILAALLNSACLWLSQVLGQGPRHLGAGALPFA